MVNTNVSPVSVSQNADGAIIQFPVSSFSRSQSLAASVSGLSGVYPGGVSGDSFTYLLPNLARLAKTFEVKADSELRIFLANTVTAGLDPVIKARLAYFLPGSPTDLITYDGVGQENDSYFVGQSKILQQEQLNAVAFRRLGVFYSVRVSDFAPNMIFSPDLAITTIQLSLKLTIKAVF